jgi:hypothetical protein
VRTATTAIESHRGRRFCGCDQCRTTGPGQRAWPARPPRVHRPRPGAARADGRRHWHLRWPRAALAMSSRRSASRCSRPGGYRTGQSPTVSRGGRDCTRCTIIHRLRFSAWGGSLSGWGSVRTANAAGVTSLRAAERAAGVAGHGRLTSH